MKDSENAEVRQRRTAHHECSHIVVAADQGLRLRSEGIMVDPMGFGFCCYNKDPQGCDLLRRRVVLATFAGYYGERRFCEEHSHTILDPQTWFVWNTDGKEAVKLVEEMSIEGLTNGSVPTTLLDLQRESERRVNHHWTVIEALARALQEKPWEQLKALPSGARWCEESQTTAKYLEGPEVIRILKQYGMAASL